MKKRKSKYQAVQDAIDNARLENMETSEDEIKMLEKVYEGKITDSEFDEFVKSRLKHV